MSKNGDPAARATASELPRARPWLWAATCVVASAVLVGGLYLPAPVRPAPVAQAVLLVLTALFAMYSFGRAKIENSALRGLHVDVTEFTDIRTGSAPSARELTAGFTRKLTESRIYSPAALPGAAGSYDFLQVVENVGEAAAASWWKVAARTLRLLRPPAAYRVTGTVADAARPKLVVELIRLPKFAAAPLIIEDTTWDRVLERAANSVAAQIFPRSRICKRRPQWASWWGYAFPTELFDAYQRAHQFQADRRFDQALAEFYRALRLDPANVYIRLEIAQLQERLNMHLDALVTYDDVITICSRGSEGLAKWWNGADFGEERSRAHRHQGVALLVARFRHALMLGHGDRIADQWWLRERECGHESHWNARQRQRGYMREMAQRRLDRYTLGDRVRAETLPFTELSREEVLRTTELSTYSWQERTERAAVLRQYLCTLSQYEFERLIADFPRYSRWIRRVAKRDSSAIVTLRGLQVSLIWAVLRRAMAQAAAQAPIRYQRVWRWTAAPPWLADLFAEGEWPAREKRLRKSIDALIPRFGHASWHEHYNVACICAVPLLEPRDKANDDSRTPFRKLAISHLHRAAAGSHSGYLAQRRSWLLYEDPDLASLRGTPEFRNFEMVTFSPTRPVPLRPLRTHVWELVSYQVGLLAGIARRMAELWADRVADDGADLVAWHALECGAWRQIARLSVSHRDWRTRHDADVFLAEELHDGRSGVALGLPTYSQEGLYTRYANAVGEAALRDLRAAMNDSILMINTISEEYIDTCNDRMAFLADALHELDGRPQGDAGCRNAKGSVWSMPVKQSMLLAGFDTTSSSARAIDRLCRERGHLWTALADVFDDDLGGVPVEERQETFAKALPKPGWRTRIARSAQPRV